MSKKQEVSPESKPRTIYLGFGEKEALRYVHRTLMDAWEYVDDHETLNDQITIARELVAGLLAGKQ